MPPRSIKYPVNSIYKKDQKQNRIGNGPNTGPFLFYAEKTGGKFLEKKELRALFTAYNIQLSLVSSEIHEIFIILYFHF